MNAHADPAAIAQATLDGFNRHYALFRDCARLAKNYFEAGNFQSAWRYAGVAAQRAEGMYAFVEAANLYSRAVEAGRQSHLRR